MDDQTSRAKRGNEVVDPIPKKRRRVEEEDEGGDMEVDGEEVTPKNEGKDDSLPLPFALVGKPAPSFTAEAAINGEIKQVSLSDHLGKWVILFFYPLDWTFVCPTEILSFSDNSDNFNKCNTQVLGVSVDSVFSHLAWVQTSRKQGGLGDVLSIPLLADVSQNIAKLYGAMSHDNSGHTVRATFLIDPKGVVRHLSFNDPPVGRSVEELLRLVQGFQNFEENGEVCPAGWQQGGQTIVPDPIKKLEYFRQQQ
uniref:thioredoxin-dependent peroxiredoxin n=1 Tax=Paramoeba aestuarina TaxID=180227 RepID=A0A7S4NU10_9EUKA|eukprot:CAMPEP_0201520338 /NCGR_PEP_ID=MMETSP0161_2-20130828/10652_1 /ASSEMBLY_ACC=CAM_ASM_000251 /TAXON_ID=180227 /ORGANISM="Neoparamoeba aestuarina, Strain SoJaBio B1-5/56/2" /LENGTH=251 /DNA_ID=CAMNT_0047918659 /DNA_START=58 /DNA_END=813 /DNA_ORIENTATION=-